MELGRIWRLGNNFDLGLDILAMALDVIPSVSLAYVFMTLPLSEVVAAINETYTAHE